MDSRRTSLVILAVMLTFAGASAITTRAIPDRDDVRSPGELVDFLAHAYREMDIDLYATLFANEREHAVEFRFVLFEPTETGESEWGYDEEIRIHRRMFRPEAVPDGERPVPQELWLRSIDVELVPLREWSERFDLYRSEHNPQGPLDRHRWRATDAEYATAVTWHTLAGSTMHIEGRARFVVIEDRMKGAGDPGKLLVYLWEDLGPGSAAVAQAAE